MKESLKEHRRLSTKGDLDLEDATPYPTIEIPFGTMTSASFVAASTSYESLIVTAIPPHAPTSASTNAQVTINAEQVVICPPQGRWLVCAIIFGLMAVGIRVIVQGIYFVWRKLTLAKEEKKSE